MKVGFTIPVCVMLAACAGTGDYQQLEDGSYKVTCSGGFHDWKGCYADAEKACKGREFVVRSRVSDEGSSSTGFKDWSAEGSTVTRSMTVMCK